MQELNGKVAIVTGGARGIGKATAELFVREGARVVIADIADDAGASLARDLGGAAIYQHTDVSKADQVEALVSKAIEVFGGIDIMFNNAGVLGSEDRTPFIESTLADFDKVLAVDLLGPMLGTKIAGRLMSAQGCGSIINTASTAGFYAGYGVPVYRAAKAGVIAITQMAAVEFGAAGVRVNCISPGPIETPIMADDKGSPELAQEIMRAVTKVLGEMQLLKRTATGIDIAHAAVFLASDRSVNITGHNLVVDGGSSVGDKINRGVQIQRALERTIAQHAK